MHFRAGILRRGKRESLRQDRVILMRLTVVGIGPGRPELLTGEARKAIEQADVVYGSERLYDEFYSLNPNTVCLPFSATIDTLLKQKEEKKYVLLASGDVGFFSISSLLKRKLQGWDLELINGLSSLQYFCSRLQTPYDSVFSLSVHGRENPVVPYVSYRPRVFLLTGGDRCAHHVIRELVEAGLGAVKVAVGENLSSEQERILKGTAEELDGEVFSSLSVMLVENENAVSPWNVLRDEDFIRGKTPMTKGEIRNVSLAALDIQPGDTVYDVGAGTGSVAIAMARRAFEGTVYALERNEDAYRLILENRKKLGAFNLFPVCGVAPESLEQLPPPDKVFIGGSGGHMGEIFRNILQKNPSARIVVNAITLESVHEAMECFTENGMQPEVTCVNSARAELVGRYHLMKAQNPVYIISGEREKQS